MKNRRNVCILALLIIFHVLSNAYIVHNSAPLGGDASFYLDASLGMHWRLREGQFREALKISSRHGPFFLYLTQPFYFLFGRSLLSASLLNDVFFTVLIVSTFLLGRELVSNTAGLLSAFLVSFYPQVHGMSRVYMLDFALTAMVCLDLYLLVRTKGLTRRKASVLLGISFGLSALIKPVFIVFLVGPLIIVFFRGFRFDLSDSITRKKLGNFLRVLIISLFLYSPLFLSRPGYILGDAHRCITINLTGESYQFWHPDNIRHWPYIMKEYQLLPFFWALFIVALVWSFFTKAIGSDTKLTLFSFLAIPFCFFTFIVVLNKDQRFILPLTIGISLVSGIFLASIRPVTLRRILIAAVVLVGLWQYWVLCYGGMDYCANHEGLLYRYFRDFDTYHLTFGWHLGIFRPPLDSSGLKEAADALIEHSRGDEDQLTALGTRAFFRPLNYLRWMGEGLPPIFLDLSPTDPLLEGYDRAHGYFLLLNMPSRGDECTSYVGEGENESIRLFEEQSDQYMLIASIPSFPCITPCSKGENHTIEIYKKIT